MGVSPALSQDEGDAARDPGVLSDHPHDGLKSHCSQLRHHLLWQEDGRGHPVPYQEVASSSSPGRRRRGCKASSLVQLQLALEGSVWLLVGKRCQEIAGVGATK